MYYKLEYCVIIWFDKNHEITMKLTVRIAMKYNIFQIVLSTYEFYDLGVSSNMITWYVMQYVTWRIIFQFLYKVKINYKFIFYRLIVTTERCYIV